MRVVDAMLRPAAAGSAGGCPSFTHDAFGVRRPDVLLDATESVAVFALVIAQAGAVPYA
jgi:hypothetical protein